MRRVLRRLSVGGLPPAVPPSGACLTLGSRMPEGALPAIAGAPNTGAVSLPLPGGNLRHYSGTRARSVAVRCAGNLLGNGPQKARQRTGHGHGDAGGLLAACHASSGAFPPPGLGLPAAVLDPRGWSFESPLQRPPDRGGRAGGPGACAQRPSGLGVTSWGKRPLLAPRPRGRLRREPAHAWQARAGRSTARQVAACRHGGDRTRARPAPQGLAGLDQRGPAPRVHGLLPCLGKTREACGVFGHGTDLCWQDEGWRRGRAAHCRAPPARGGAPVGPASGAAIVSQHAGGATARGGLESAAGLRTGPAAGAPRGGVPRGPSNRGALPRARQAGQWHGVPAVGWAAVPGLFGPACGGHPPAGVVCLRQRAGAPGAPGAGGRDPDPMGGRRGPRAAAWIAVTLPGPQGPEGEDRGAVLVGDSGNGDGLRVDRHADREGARRLQRCPPSGWG
jgi:hypothetical protein